MSHFPSTSGSLRKIGAGEHFSSFAKCMRRNQLYFYAINRQLCVKCKGVRYFLLASIFYFAGIFGIILASVRYRDDLMRSMFGQLMYDFESRMVSQYASMILGMMDYETQLIADASPLFQLLAVFVLASGSVVLTRTINGKLSIYGLIASLPLGLSPYFLSNLSYKFDAPYHALSIVASIVPFLYLRRTSIFVPASVLGILVTFSTYQGAHGIYILLSALVVACSLAKIDDCGFTLPQKKVFSFIVWSALSYVLALAIYYIFIYNKNAPGYKSGSALFSFDMATAARNVVLYLKIMQADLHGTLFEVLFAFVCVFFMATFVSRSKGRGGLVFAFLFMLFAFFASYGMYFFLEVPFLRTRTFCGFGVFLAVLAVFISREGVLDKVLVCLLGYSLIVTSFVYANSLSDQHKYSSFRRNMMIVDLLKVLPAGESEGKINIHVKSSFINPAPSTANSIAYFPLLRRINFEFFGEDMYFTQWQFRDVRFDYIPYNDYWRVRFLGKGERRGYRPKPEERSCKSAYMSTHESIMNTILKFEGNCYEVYFKPGSLIWPFTGVNVIR